MVEEVGQLAARGELRQPGQRVRVEVGDEELPDVALKIKELLEVK